MAVNPRCMLLSCLAGWMALSDLSTAPQSFHGGDGSLNQLNCTRPCQCGQPPARELKEDKYPIPPCGTGSQQAVIWDYRGRIPQAFLRMHGGPGCLQKRGCCCLKSWLSLGITLVSSRATPATVQLRHQSARFNWTGIFIAGLAANYRVFVSDFLM